MRTLGLFLLVAAATTFGCGGCSDSRRGDSSSNSSADVGTDAVVSTDVRNEPDARGDTGSGFEPGGIDPELLAVLPRDYEGDPMVFSGPSALAPGVDVVFSIGGPPEDPIGYWAACVDFLLQCQEGADFDAECVSRIPVCDSPAGGLDCCPQACAGQIKRDVDWSPGRRALDNLLRGSCIDGFDAYVDEFGTMQPVLP